MTETSLSPHLDWYSFQESTAKQERPYHSLLLDWMEQAVDEAGDQRVPGKLDAARGGVAFPGQARGKDLADAPIECHDGVVREHRSRGIDRNDPAGLDQEGNRISQARLHRKQKSPALRQGF